MSADASRLVEQAAEFGSPIVRRAYGNWNMAGMQALQGQLVTNGFQLIHVPYPVPKKSAADIAMVVDVMATQHRMQDLTCFVLAPQLVRSTVKVPGPLAAPERGSCGSPRRARQLWVTRHPQRRAQATGRPATASAARASHLQSRRFSCILLPLALIPGSAGARPPRPTTRSPPTLLRRHCTYCHLLLLTATYLLTYYVHLPTTSLLRTCYLLAYLLTYYLE